MTALSGALPKGEANGLAGIAHKLIESPSQIHVAVVLLNVKKITTEVDTAERIATVRVLRIEPIDGQDRQLAAQLMRRALEERTGQTVLPIDIEDDIAEALAQVKLDDEDV